ncbi:uncharacterized protein H6S33_000449 [Morchella sextelata]|uniref:uncharacterized protein n=1 Tax=Morchella sextelata TaxID=1174677 RepID=UPI001D055367|nr:uncharacterized protein H6S33_000449 [Morchella sextelata]KAH0614813.1 hypothetical protein H6S33_000449 [Morchella sextelata]
MRGFAVSPTYDPANTRFGIGPVAVVATQTCFGAEKSRLFSSESRTDIWVMYQVHDGEGMIIKAIEGCIWSLKAAITRAGKRMDFR